MFWDNWYAKARGTAENVQAAEALPDALFQDPVTTNASVDPADVFTNPVTGVKMSIRTTTVYGAEAPSFFEGVKIQDQNGNTIETKTGPATKNFGGLLSAINKISAPGFLKSTLAKTVLILVAVALAGIFVYGFSRPI